MGDWELPRSMVARAREFLTSGGAVAAARPAATVVLLRPCAARAPEATPVEGFEVYAIRRARSMAFASGVYAFPGGGVDAADATADIGWVGPTPREWGKRLGLAPAAAQAVVCAAVRELFEETGVLLADRTLGERERLRLVRRETHLTAVLAEHGLELRSDLLHPWARWITPEFEPRRYDTFFFLAELPAGQRAEDVSGEADLTVWITPERALGDAGMRMLPPTRMTLRELAAYPDAATLIAAAAGREISTVMPRAVLGEDGAVRLEV